METIAAGTRVRLSGGYNAEPIYLGGRTELLGSVVQFIPGGTAQLAAVVKLDSPVTANGATAEFAVLQLRYADARWRSRETVHVELCDFEPEPKPVGERRAGRWLESHATFEILPT